MRTPLALIAAALLSLGCGFNAYCEGNPRADAIRRGKAALGARHAAVRALMSFLDNEQVFAERPDEAAEAVRLLGELRAQEAVPILLEHVDFVPTPPWRGPELRDAPCAVALVRIGLPAMAQLVKLVGADPEVGGWLAFQAIRVIDGNALASARLQLAAERELEPERKQRLLAAAQSLQGFGTDVPDIGD